MIRQVELASMKALSAVIIAAAALPVLAHHSHNAYEITVWSNLEGTVKEVHLMNPHSWIYLDVVAANAETTTWALEAAGPGSITENGVKPEDVRPGDRIKVRIHLLRDGANGGLLGFVTPMHGDQARGHGIELEWD
jgi:hypothetical protein